MRNIGLALSGGGFRASLYHLGLVRFLRDAGLLERVTHITSVSGGSIFSAHLVLNWDRYNGSPNDFDAVASEFLSFINLDVRNRIVRRFPLALPFMLPRRLMGLSNRRLTRTGLLEGYYERHLYGDTSLFQLPEHPELHLLATNLSEGCLCSFNRNGLLMVRRQAGNGIRLDRIHVGLATVPMAVTASSAFPAFFPPLELTGEEVGVSVGEFGRQAFTDGAVFDNLGVRMFRCLKMALLTTSPLTKDDFADFPATMRALHGAGETSNESPLHRFAQILETHCNQAGTSVRKEVGSGNGVQILAPPSDNCACSSEEAFSSRFEDILRHHQLQREPLFAGLKPADPEAEVLLQSSRSGSRSIGGADQFWLNRHLFESAYRQATGQPCFRRLDSGLDGVLASDVGKAIEAQGERRAGGLIQTALRASGILMDRVWQLEKETFQHTPHFVFAPITDVVEPSEDPTALHPEIQRQLPNIRTDLDRFSPLEISCLIRQGYCVARKVCREHPAAFGDALPGNPPWDPIAAPQGVARTVSPPSRPSGPPRQPAAATLDARTLQASAFMRTWSTLLDFRDWSSYVYVPLLVPILFLLPYFGFQYYQHTHRINRLIGSLSHGSRDFDQMSYLLENRPTAWTGVVAEEVAAFDKPNLKGFEILQESHVYDLREWKPIKPGNEDQAGRVYGYRRLKVLKRLESEQHEIFPVDLLTLSPQTTVRFPPQQLEPKLRKRNVADSSVGEKKYHWQASFDFAKVPAGDTRDLYIEHQSPGAYLQAGANGAAIAVPVRTDTAELTMWLLMPEGREYQDFHIVRYPIEKPDLVESVKLVSEYLPEDYTILAFKLLSLRPGYTYEVGWIYR
jgi:predicted acylesterase/phospholipase RssA